MQKCNKFKWFGKLQKEYMDRQISQKIEFYRREEKRLRLYFDIFCNLFKTEIDTLMYIYSNNVHKCYKKPLRKAQRPIKALDPSKSHHFETEMCGPSCF